MTAMLQQVNLLVDDLLPRRMLLGATQALLAAAACTLVLVAASAAALLESTRLEQRQTVLGRQLAQLADANAEARAAVKNVADPQLVARVDELQAQLQSRATLQAALATDTPGLAPGFSDHLDELAHDVIPRLWLTDIELADGGRRIRLAGITLDPALVPTFLENLGRGRAFGGHRFDAFELTADEDGVSRFTIDGPGGAAK